MKNIINEKPTDKLFGRTLYTTKFIQDKDLKDKKVLDIGCGYGWFELYAEKRGVKKIIGLELSKKDLETAEKYIKNRKISFQVGDATKLPFKNNVFDTVVAWEVIEHIPENMENIMFIEVNRVLKKNGVFYLSTPNASLFSNIFDPAWWLTGHRHYDKDILCNFAVKTGFVTEKSEIKGSWWEIVRLLDLYIAKWIFHQKPFLIKFYSDKKRTNIYFKKKGFVNIYLKVRKFIDFKIK